MDGDVKNERERRWRGHLAAWRTSGLSQAAYCRQHGLTQNDFSWWKREIARRAVAAAPAFVPVSIAPPLSAPHAFELVLRDGRELRFDGRVDPAELGVVVRALEAAGLKPGAGSC
jgi:transposase